MTTGNRIARRGVHPERGGAATETLLFADDSVSCFARVIATLRAVKNRIIPFGYEDESGFHYGAMPDSSRSN